MTSHQTQDRALTRSHKYLGSPSDLPACACNLPYAERESVLAKDISDYIHQLSKPDSPPKHLEETQGFIMFW